MLHCIFNDVILFFTVYQSKRLHPTEGHATKDLVCPDYEHWKLYVLYLYLAIAHYRLFINVDLLLSRVQYKYLFLW